MPVSLGCGSAAAYHIDLVSAALRFFKVKRELRSFHSGLKGFDHIGRTLRVDVRPHCEPSFRDNGLTLRRSGRMAYKKLHPRRTALAWREKLERYWNNVRYCSHRSPYDGRAFLNLS